MDENQDRVDLIVVGGGVSGLVCAMEAARAGLNVVLLERGDFCGSKSVTGGRLYLHPLKGVLSEEVFGSVVEAPFERKVCRESLVFIKGEQFLMFECDCRFDTEMPNSVTVLRAKFDRYLAEKAESMGVVIVPEARVDEIVFSSDGLARGVRVRDDVIEGDFVVLAEGAARWIARSSALFNGSSSPHYCTGVKEVYSISSEKINDRFGLREDEGCATLVAGDFLEGISGGGFIYTNRDTVSVGVVLNLNQLSERCSEEIKPHVLMDCFGSKRPVADFISDGKLVEYSAKIIPEFRSSSDVLWGRSNVIVVGDCAGFVANHLVTVRGMDLAMASGSIAAGVICQLMGKKKQKACAVDIYRQKIKDSFVWKDFLRALGAHRFINSSKSINFYGDRFLLTVRELFRVGEGGKSIFLGGALKDLRKMIFSVGGIKNYLKMRKF